MRGEEEQAGHITHQEHKQTSTCKDLMSLIAGCLLPPEPLDHLPGKGFADIHYSMFDSEGSAYCPPDADPD